MKLATLKSGSRDGTLVVVSRDLRRCAEATAIAPTLQAALDSWSEIEAPLAQLAVRLEHGQDIAARPFDPAEAAAPLPRAYQWVDGSAYVNHVELVRKARGADLPQSFWTEPLVYQGGSDDLLGARDDAMFVSEDHGIDFEGEIAVITDDVRMGASPSEALGRIRLVMLVNDWSLRNLIPAELGKGFGFYQSKPSTGFSAVAVTPDELRPAWREGRLHRRVRCAINGTAFGSPDAGTDMTFGFNRLIAHAAATRNLRAGTIVGSGTVSNKDRSAGSCCIVERRTLEQLEKGAPSTPYLEIRRSRIYRSAGRCGREHLRRDRADRRPGKHLRACLPGSANG